MGLFPAFLTIHLKKVYPQCTYSPYNDAQVFGITARDKQNNKPVIVSILLSGYCMSAVNRNQDTASLFPFIALACSSWYLELI